MRQIDFERVAADRSKSRMYADDEEVIQAALRIASRVTAQGVIEAAVTRRLNDESSPTDDDLSAAIRTVLLGQ